MLQRLVVDLNLSFEVWSQRSSSSKEWELSSRGSPGNFDAEEWAQEEGVGSNVMGGGVMAALVEGRDGNGGRAVGVAVLDTLTSMMGVSVCADGDEQMSSVEALLVQAGVRECLLQQSPQSLRMLQRCDVAAAVRNAAHFKTASLMQDLERLLSPHHHRVAPQALPETQMTLAMQALAALVKEYDLVADTASHGRYQLKSLNPDLFMRLDASAVEALNLLPSAADANKSMSLYGRLNTCKTPMGQRKLLQWVRQPLMDVDLIRMRQDMVQAMMEDAALRSMLQQAALRKVPDLQRLSIKILKGKAGLQDVMKLYQCVLSLPSVLEAVHNARDAVVRERYEHPLKQAVADFSNFCNMVETSLDLEAIEDGNYRIKHTFDEGLMELHTGLTQAMRTLKQEQSRMLEATGIRKIELEDKKGMGWVLRVTKKEQKSCEDAAKKMKETLEEVASQKAGWYFRTSKMRKASTTHEELQAEYERVQSKLVSELMVVVQGYVPCIEVVAEVLSDLDVYASLGHVFSSSSRPYVRPTITPAGHGSTILLQARHPCLETQDDVTYVPNDVRFVRGERELIVMTGPNMGGKSTYVRACGMIVLMAQMGCFVPCTQASVSCADAILCRVGAGDSQARGVSTFMAEMLDTAHILRVATQSSLVIVDELGRGTSTYDGFGLAWAIAEHLATKTKAFSFFATHFHELTRLEQHIGTVKNAHVSAKADGDQLTLLYAVREGPCDQSFGIHVAEMARFPAQVLAMARRKAKQLEQYEPTLKRARVEGDNNQVDEIEMGDVREKREGEQQIVNFLESFRNLNPDDDVLNRVQQMTQQLYESGNGFVKKVIDEIRKQ